MYSASRRQFLSSAILASAASSLSTDLLRAGSANDEIRLGFISCGNRAGKLMDQFSSIPGVVVAALADVDQERLEIAKERFPAAKGYSDLRALIEDDNLDAVVIATCNHWHCLAAIWAMEAGLDVYVEKPLSHSQWEGKQAVAAARHYDRICQVGTQQRSDPMQAQIKNFLHQEKALGEIDTVKVNHYMIRRPIGKNQKPLAPNPSLAYDLWLGPAQEQPIYRDQLHYDWHWDWNTGSGEMGNWGVHILDDVRNNLFQDSVSLPRRVIAGGGRIGFDDAGQTPNVQFAYFDTGVIPVVIGLTNLPRQPKSTERAEHQGPHSGYIAYCEGGRFEGQRGRAVAFDQNGKVVKEFRGNRGDVAHQANFIEAVRAQDRSILNAEIAVGNDSTGWCNLANVALRSGDSSGIESIQQIQNSVWQALISSMSSHLQAHGSSLHNPEIRMSSMLGLDSRSECFVGKHASLANQYLNREYRNGFEVPRFV